MDVRLVLDESLINTLEAWGISSVEQFKAIKLTTFPKVVMALEEVTMAKEDRHDKKFIKDTVYAVRELFKDHNVTTWSKNKEEEKMKEMTKNSVEYTEFAERNILVDFEIVKAAKQVVDGFAQRTEAIKHVDVTESPNAVLATEICEQIGSATEIKKGQGFEIVSLSNVYASAINDEDIYVKEAGKQVHTYDFPEGNSTITEPRAKDVNSSLDELVTNMKIDARKNKDSIINRLNTFAYNFSKKRIDYKFTAGANDETFEKFLKVQDVKFESLRGVEVLKVTKKNGSEVFYTGSNQKGGIKAAFSEQIISCIEFVVDAADNNRVKIAKKLYPSSTIDGEMSPILLIDKNDIKYNRLTIENMTRLNSYVVDSNITFREKENERLVKSHHLGMGYTSANALKRAYCTAEETVTLLKRLGKAQKVAAEKAEKASGFTPLVSERQNLLYQQKDEDGMLYDNYMGKLFLTYDPFFSQKPTRINAGLSAFDNTRGLIYENFIGEDGIETLITNESTKLGLVTYIMSEDGKSYLDVSPVGIDGGYFTDMSHDGHEMDMKTAKYMLAKGVVKQYNDKNNTSLIIDEYIKANGVIKGRESRLKGMWTVSTKENNLQLEDQELQAKIVKTLGLLPHVISNYVPKAEKKVQGVFHQDVLNKFNNDEYNGYYDWNEKTMMKDVDLQKVGLKGTITGADGKTYKTVSMFSVLSQDVDKSAWNCFGSGKSKNTPVNHQGMLNLLATIGTPANDFIFKDSKEIISSIRSYNHEVVRGDIINIETFDESPVRMILSANDYENYFVNNNNYSELFENLKERFVKGFEILIEDGEGNLVEATDTEKYDVEGSDNTKFKYVRKDFSGSDICFIRNKNDITLMKLVENKHGERIMIREGNMIETTPNGRPISESFLNANYDMLQKLIGVNFSTKPEDADTSILRQDWIAENKKAFRRTLRSLKSASSCNVFEDLYINIPTIGHISGFFPVAFNNVLRVLPVIRMIALEFGVATVETRAARSENVEAAKRCMLLLNDKSYMKKDDLIGIIEKELSKLGRKMRYFNKDQHASELSIAMGSIISRRRLNKENIFAKKGTSLFTNPTPDSLYRVVVTVAGLPKNTVCVHSSHKHLFEEVDGKYNAMFVRPPQTGMYGLGVNIIFNDDMPVDAIYANGYEFAILMGDVDGDMGTLFTITSELKDAMVDLMPENLYEYLTDKFAERTVINEVNIFVKGGTKVYKADGSLEDYTLLDLSYKALVERVKTFKRSVEPQFAATGLCTAALMKMLHRLLHAGAPLAITRPFQLTIIKLLAQIPIAAKNTKYTEDNSEEKSVTEQLSESINNFAGKFDINAMADMLELAGMLDEEEIKELYADKSVQEFWEKNVTL